MTDNKMDDGCPSFHFCVHTRTDLVWFLGGDKYARDTELSLSSDRLIREKN